VGLLCDFLMVPLFVTMMPGPFAVGAPFCFAVLGVVLAQGNVLAAWLVWSEGPFPRRLALHWGAAAVFCWAWLAGVAMSVRSHEFEVMRCTIVLAVPLVSMAAQLPLWAARQLFGWRLVRDDAETPVLDEPPL